MVKSGGGARFERIKCQCSRKVVEALHVGSHDAVGEDDRQVEAEALALPFVQVRSCCDVARRRQSHLDRQLRSNAREGKEALGCFTSGARGWSIRSATVAVCLGRILQLSIQCSDGLRRSASRSRCGGNRGLTSTGGSRLRRQQARVLTAKMLLMFGRAVFRRWGIPAWRGPFESGAGNVAALLQPFFFQINRLTLCLRCRLSSIKQDKHDIAIVCIN